MLKKFLLFFVVVIMSIGGMRYWYYSNHYVRTDNAYINADVVQIAPRVTGQVTRLLVTNNQYVNSNHILFEIDSEPFVLAANEAAAQLTRDQAQLNIAELTANRTLELVAKKAASAQSGDTAKADLRSARAAIEVSKANLARVQLNLNYTKINAPTSGWVTNLSLQTGNVVQANQPLFALISDKIFWVDANFKETELSRIKPQQIVDVVVDMYPKHHFKGVVESISGGTGTVFSLLPPQNATGNWVKVTQRVPVRIRITNPDPKFPLRIGTSAWVIINIG